MARASVPAAIREPPAPADGSFAWPRAVAGASHGEPAPTLRLPSRCTPEGGVRTGLDAPPAAATGDVGGKGV
jgi:hypothetical protein